MTGNAAVKSGKARGRGFWRLVNRRLAAGLDRASVFAEVEESGRATGRYAMMSVLSAAIATLGLLLSSPAVVIGAMLLSPLMGPIILLGFAFWTIDWAAARRAVLSLAIGFGLALAVAVLLTWLSPIKEPTDEILSRTRPNLFDLLVAAFSGIAGGYAVIRQRGETVIGVAIATALMPPIATVGFGLGVRNWPITLGALLLFATNLVAIALAAAGMAALYGFRPHLANRGWIGHGLVILMVGVLCVPLTFSLNTIAMEGRATSKVRAAIHKVFGPKTRVTTLTVRSEGRALRADALVATPKYVDGAARRIKADLGRMGRPLTLNVDQVVLADPAKLAEAATGGQKSDPSADRVDALRAMIPYASAEVSYDPTMGAGVVLLEPAEGLDLAAAHGLETAIRAHDGFAKTLVVPPLQSLVPVGITSSPKGIDFDGGLAVDVWAVTRWRVAKVQVAICGLSARAASRLNVQALATEALGANRVSRVVVGGPACAGPPPGPNLRITPAPGEG